MAINDFDPGWFLRSWLNGGILIFIVIFLVVSGFRSNNSVSAGAEWLARSRSIIDTYELTMIRTSASGPADALLDLEDKQGHTMSIELSLLQENQKLWNLVYNGMAHSAAYNNAELKGLNYDKFLRLDRFQGRPSGDPWSYWHDPWPRTRREKAARSRRADARRRTHLASITR